MVQNQGSALALYMISCQKGTYMVGNHLVWWEVSNYYDYDSPLVQHACHSAHACIHTRKALMLSCVIFVPTTEFWLLLVGEMLN